MCRFLLLKSKVSVRLCDMLTNPAHSIIKQSYDSRLRVDDTRPLNGDGFGVGWYVDGDETPCVFTSVMPAWSNPNLNRLADKTSSRLFFAHVRAASANTPISESNCHPWQYLNFLWMHNGYIAEFPKIRRRLLQTLPDELFDIITGNTDSEHIFALFLSQLEAPLHRHFSCDEMRAAMLKAIRLINKWSLEAGITQSSLLNLAVSNGNCVVTSRYNNVDPSLAASLFYSSGTRFECTAPGQYRMVKADRRDSIVVVASEPTSFHLHDWLPVPVNSFICLTEHNNVLIYPIEDLLYTPEEASPSVDPMAAHQTAKAIVQNA